MAKPANAAKSFTKTYTFDRDTKGTWVYMIDGEEGERHSGSNAIYLLKTEYPNKPGDKLSVTVNIG